jgi:diguanylate cyclase (GGDEF)-like protein
MKAISLRWTLLIIGIANLVALAAYIPWWNSIVSIVFGNGFEVLVLALAAWNFVNVPAVSRSGATRQFHSMDFLGLGLSVWVIGELMESYCNIVLQQVSYGGVTDLFWLLGYVLMIAGMISHLRERNHGRLPDELWTQAMVLLAGYAFLFYLIVIPYLEDPARTWASKLLDFLYPTADFVIILAASLSYIAARSNEMQEHGKQSLVIGSAFLLVLIADFFLIGVSNFNSPIYRALTVGYLPAYSLLALAGCMGKVEEKSGTARRGAKPYPPLRAGEEITRMKRFLQLNHRIHSTLELQEAMQILLKETLDFTRMERGFIMQFNEQGNLESLAGYHQDSGAVKGTDFQISQSIVRSALSSGKLFYFTSTEDQPSASARKLGLAGAFCVPIYACRSIISEKEALGILYVDSQNCPRFGRQEEEIITALALHAGLAVENARLFSLATLDGLTRVFQRRHFDCIADIEWKRGKRHNRPLSIMMLDIDHFKRINDTFGHHQGDTVLRKVAALLKSACRAGDIIGRYGGEEFIILMPDTDVEGAKVLAHRIEQLLAGHFNGKTPWATLSIGIACTAICEADGVHNLICAADAALYHAKQLGRNRTEIYHPEQVLQFRVV